MVGCHHPSHNSMTWASISTATLGAAPHVRRAVLRCFAAFRLLSLIYVVKSPTTAFVLSWSRSSTQGWIMATSCLLGFLPIFNDVYSPYSSRSSFDIPTLSDALVILHWLRLPERVNFKLALIAYRVLNGMASSYLNKLVPVSSMSGRCCLRSSFTLQLHISQYRLSIADRRSFTVAASIFWNTLPDDEQSAPSVSDRFLFHQSFPDIIV